MKLQDFLVQKGIKESDLAAKTAEELAGIYNEYNSIKSEELEKAIEAKASKEDIDSLKSELKENQVQQIKALNDTLKEYGVAIKKLSAKEKEETLGSQNSIFSGLKSGIETLKSIKGGSNERLKFKAAATMLISSNVSGGNVPVEQRLTGLDDIPSREVRLLNIVSRGTAESNVISWVSKQNRDGAAGGTAEGDLKNQIDFDIVVNSETRKKFTAFIKLSEEMSSDIGFMDTEINNELVGELLREVESQVYSGDGTSLNLNGIFTPGEARRRLQGRPNCVYGCFLKVVRAQKWI